MSLATLKTFWANTSALNTALPASKVFLDYVPPTIAPPYCRLTVIGSDPLYVTAESHVEVFSYQLSIFHTDLDALTTIVTAVAGALDHAAIDANTLTNQRTNWLPQGEVVNGVYTYHSLLEYEWSYNTSSL